MWMISSSSKSGSILSELQLEQNAVLVLNKRETGPLEQRTKFNSRDIDSVIKSNTAWEGVQWRIVNSKALIRLQPSRCYPNTDKFTRYAFTKYSCLIHLQKSKKQMCFSCHSILSFKYCTFLDFRFRGDEGKSPSILKHISFMPPKNTRKQQWNFLRAPKPWNENILEFSLEAPEFT